MERLLVERGLVAADEMAAGRALRPGKPLKHGKLTPADIGRVMARGSFGRPATAAVMLPRIFRSHRWVNC